MTDRPAVHAPPLPLAAAELVRLAGDSAGRGLLLLTPSAGDPEQIETATGPAASEPEAVVTVYVADASADGRALAGLAAELWRAAPAVAVLLLPAPLTAGAVRFSPAAAQTVAGLSEVGPGDAIGRAIDAVLVSGGTLWAVVTDPAAEDYSTTTTDPPALTPALPTAKRRAMADRIAALDPSHLIGRVASPPDAAAVKAGLLLWHDLLDASHAVSQSIEGQGRNRAGDYWHAIMHRREGDYGNARYWFRRVAPQPFFHRLRLHALTAGEAIERRVTRGPLWDAAGFVDVCEEADRSGDADLDLALRRLQADEMLLLLHQTVRNARGV